MVLSGGFRRNRRILIVQDAERTLAGRLLGMLNRDLVLGRCLPRE